MAYYFMLGVVPLPITPSALTIKTPSMNKTVTLINDGEINIPKDQGLREISFEFLLPTVQKYPFANYQLGSYTATALIPLLNVWKRTLLPFPFIVARMSPAGKFLYFTSIKCVIEDFEYKEDAEEYGLDMMCSITLKEYKPYATKRIKLKDAPDGSRNTLAQLENTRDDSSMLQDSTIFTSITSTLSSILPFSRINVDVANVEKESIISACKRNGDNPLSVFDLNHIKIPEIIKNSEAVSCFERLELPSNFTYTKSEDTNVGNNSSLVDILMFGSAGKGYKSPSVRKADAKSQLQVIISKIVSV